MKKFKVSAIFAVIINFSIVQGWAFSETEREEYLNRPHTLLECPQDASHKNIKEQLSNMYYDLELKRGSKPSVKEGTAQIQGVWWTTNLSTFSDLTQSVVDKKILGADQTLTLSKKDQCVHLPVNVLYDYIKYNHITDKYTRQLSEIFQEDPSRHNENVEVSAYWIQKLLASQFLFHII